MDFPTSMLGTVTKAIEYSDLTEAAGVVVANNRLRMGRDPLAASMYVETAATPNAPIADNVGVLIVATQQLELGSRWWWCLPRSFESSHGVSSTIRVLRYPATSKAGTKQRQLLETECADHRRRHSSVFVLKGFVTQHFHHSLRKLRKQEREPRTANILKP